MLILFVIIGISWPLPGRALASADLNGGACVLIRNSSATISTERDVCVWSTVGAICITMVFLIAGLQLDTKSVVEALKARRAFLTGVVLILFVTTSLGFAVAADRNGLQPPEFKFGVALFLLMPTTLSTCSVVTNIAQGNVPLSLLLSVTTNLLGVLILPIFVAWMIQLFYANQAVAAVSISLDVVGMVINLIFTLLFPLIVGKVLRDVSPSIQRFVLKHSLALKVASAFFLCAIPWMKISQSADTFSTVSAQNYVILIFACVGIHALYLVLNYTTTRFLIPLNLSEQKAVVLCASQKTLPVAMSVLELLPATVVSNPGLVAIPIIIAHLFQTVMDATLAAKWASWTAVKVSDAHPVKAQDNSAVKAGGDIPDKVLGDDFTVQVGGTPAKVENASPAIV